MTFLSTSEDGFVPSLSDGLIAPGGLFLLAKEMKVVMASYLSARYPIQTNIRQQWTDCRLLK
jgi:hypothetical protein